MTDLISRRALLAEYDRVHIGPPGGARKLMEEAPAVDAVEVVRCKDCKYFKKMSDGYTKCSHKYGLAMVLLNTYCSRGERKENEID